MLSFTHPCCSKLLKPFFLSDNKIKKILFQNFLAAKIYRKKDRKNKRFFKIYWNFLAQ